MLLYGPLDHAGAELRRLVSLRKAEPISADLTVNLRLEPDALQHGQMPSRMQHRALTSGGPIDTVLEGGANDIHVCATASRAGSERVIAVSRRNANGANSGTLGWVRGSFCCSIDGGRLPAPDDPSRYFQGEALMRLMLAEFGYSIRLAKPLAETRSPLILASRHRNGYYLSCYSPSTTASVRLRFPHGAPIIVGAETWMEDGHSVYTPPRAWHKEVRCLVDQQENGEVSCVEAISEFPFIERRLMVSGLKNATVHFYPQNDRKVIMAVNDLRFYNQDSIPYTREDGGSRLVAKAITGKLVISW